MAKINSTLQGFSLLINGSESLEELEVVLRDFAQDTMANNAVGICVEFPVHEKNDIRDEMIGLVSITTTDQEFEIRHYMIGRAESE